MMVKRICIIGAGPSGLAQLRSFQSALGLSDEEMDEISEQAKSTAQDAD